MKGFKGFDKDMKCRGFQYAENQEFKEDVKPSLCNRGLHFCESPLDVFDYYSPADNNQFAEVESLGVTETENNKSVTNHLSVGAKIGIFGLAKAHVELVMSKITNTKIEANTGYRSASTNTGDRSASTNTGDYSASTNTGDQSASTNTGYRSASTNTGDYSASTNTGNYSASTNTGDYSASTNTGNYSASTNTGYRSASTNTGYRSASTNTGNYSASTNTGKYGIACALGYKSKAKATSGAIVIIDWRYKDNEIYMHDIHSAKVGKKIKGVTIMPDTFYWVEDGELKSE
jgi:hypothetical protein